MTAIDDHIIDSIEGFFLPKGVSFDDERRNFIKNLSSCDLLAVPGSGKTTALLAKLACVVRCKEASDGILVLSHTNTAVDEIKNKLGGGFGTIFNYPNCVCTVQEFVDTFLAIPIYENLTHSSIDIIDADRYEEELQYELSHIHDSPIAYLKARQYKFNKLRFGIKDGAVTVGEGIECHDLQYEIPRRWAAQEDENKKFIVTKLLEVKKRILKKGVLHYDDCYFLAYWYISFYPTVINFIRKRFKYIFVDEAQDLARHQIEIIDRLFHCDGCILQRVGDNNQSIYHKVSEYTIWEPRSVMYINNSQRLTPEIADVVNAFTLDKGLDINGNVLFNVVGKRALDSSIPPYLLLYKEDTMRNLENTFRRIIDQYSLAKTEEAKKYGFHIIGWCGNKLANYDVNKIRLEDIFPQRVISNNATKGELNNLSDYIRRGREKNTICDCRYSALSAMCRALRLSGVRDNNKRFYTPKSLDKHITQQEQFKEDYEKAVYDVSILIHTKQYEAGYNLLKGYIRNHLATTTPFRENQALLDFLGDKYEDIVADLHPAVQNQEAFPIEVSTVHHVKGMTHCATMYVETYFCEYECNHLIKETRSHLKGSPFFKDSVKVTASRAKQAMKMLYVGMSRPTHLLCYASLKQNWNDVRLQKMKDVGWQVIEV